MKRSYRLSPKGREKLGLLEPLLHRAYREPEALLGNQADPLDEAVYIILSFQTDIPRLERTWQNLRSAYRDWKEVHAASLDELATIIRAGGLHRQKAKSIKELLAAVKREFGELSLNPLHDLSDNDAEDVLTRLPGMSWKGARCVLLYSLDRNVFPIDSNAFRILRRVGIIASSGIYRRRSLHDGVQAAVNPELRRRFHVNLVLHGQQVCLPERPQCTRCPAAAICAKRQLPASNTRSSIFVRTRTRVVQPTTRPPRQESQHKRQSTNERTGAER